MEVAEVRVLAARFADRNTAAGVLERLRARFRLGADDADVAPLGDGNDRQTVLAGRFREENVGAVKDLVREAGGEVVADIDERWTRASTPPTVRQAVDAPTNGRRPPRREALGQDWGSRGPATG